MSDLSTDFKDDILNTDINTRRKYQMINNEDGTVSFVDVTSYSQNGSPFGAKEVNETRSSINHINWDLDNNYGFKYQREYNKIYKIKQTSFSSLTTRDKAIYVPLNIALQGNNDERYLVHFETTIQSNLEEASTANLTFVFCNIDGSAISSVKSETFVLLSGNRSTNISINKMVYISPDDIAADMYVSIDSVNSNINFESDSEVKASTLIIGA